jgi:regulation of enolase protein 1 (concanavalin A-like superfamily)/phosphatidylserine/phosphatidylglycerophosphate/cardiolipin synthase-like enzyme
MINHPTAPYRLRARVTLCALLLLLSHAGAARAQDQIYFPAVDNTVNLIVQHMNAETVRIDVSAWYLTEHLISETIVARMHAGVQVRVIGDRGSIFEIDPSTKQEFYYLANAGVPIRLRYNPNWFPEIDHMKMAVFKGQGIVEFGSANWATYELTPASSTNYSDETVMFTSDPVLVGALESRFDQIWNDTTKEPESIISGPPYLKNWYDACALEANCSDFSTLNPTPAPMVINTARLEPDNPVPADMIWGQGPDFNNRLVTEINNETTRVKFVIYRLTVGNIPTALLNKFKSGVPAQVIIEPGEYLNRKWPEFWLTHANLDLLWAAGIPMKQRAHQGLTHMKMIVTSAYATNASSNYSAAWQRDNDYFVSSTLKPTIYQAMSSRFDTMWNDTVGFAPFVPTPADTPVQSSPANGAAGVPTTPALTWATAVFAVSYDVYLGTSPSTMTFAGNVPAQLNNNPPSTYSFTPATPLQGGTTYFWKVVSRTFAADVNPSLLRPSGTSSFTTTGTSSGPPPASLPSPWAQVDIGSTGLAGSASSAVGVFTVNGAGSDIWSTADSFHFVYQPLSGDGQIVARVASEQNTSSFAKAGVMLRETLTSTATNVILDLNPTGNAEFMARSSTGAATAWLAGAAQSAPAWLRLVRSGTTITGSVSADGVTWTTVGTTTVSMATNIFVGLVVCSHTTSALNTSAFDNVTVQTTTGAPPPPPPPPTLPSPWVSADVGATGVAGSASFSSGVFTVNGAGADIWGTSDSFHYVYQSLAGDGQIVARITGEQNTSAFAKAGVMMRNSLSATDANVMLDLNPSGNVEFMARPSAGAATAWLAGAVQSPPAWVRLARAGSTVTAAVSADGVTWTPVGTTTVSMATNIFVGLVVCSHTTSALNTSTFDNVTVSSVAPPPPPPLPSPWASVDVGGTGLAGSASASSGVFTVNGAGADIWGTSDSFQFVYQTLVGDGQIVARVTGEQNTSAFAKAGVMMRNSLSATDANVILDLNPGGNVEFMARSTSGAATAWLSGTTHALPAWVMLARTGSTVTASVSSDGTTWTTVGTTSVPMGASVFVGLVVCSHTTSALNTSTFDNVTVK